MTTMRARLSGAVLATAVAATTSVMVMTAPLAAAAGPTTIAGVVTDASTGAPVGGVEVDVVIGSSLQPGASTVASAVTDASGGYSIPLAGLASAADPVTVDLVDPAGSFGVSYANPVTLVDDDTVFAPFALDPGAVVTGTVTGAGAGPLAGSCVTVRDSATRLVLPAGAAGSCSDASGAYSLPALAAGTYTFTFASPDLALWHSIPAQQVTATAGAPVVADATLLPVRSTSITGVVTELGTSTPLAGIEVTATTTDEAGTAQTLTATTDATGAFTLAIAFQPGTPFVIDVVDPTGAHHPANGITISVQAGYTEAIGVTLQPSNVTPTADVSARGATKTLIIGQPDVIEVSVTNAGPTVATGVTLTTQIPLTVAVDRIDAPSGFSCNVAALHLTCTAPALGVQRTAVVRLAVSPGGPGSFYFPQTAVTTTSIDPEPSNNTSFNFLAVQDNQADLSVTLDNGPLEVGVVAPVTFGVRNEGPATAHDVFAVVRLPAGLTVDRVEAVGWTCAIAGQEVGCSVASLAPNEQLTARAIVTPTALAAALPISASVGSSTPDFSPWTNGVDETIDVVQVGSVDLSVSGFPFFFSPIVNRPATLVFNASNFGPAVANDVQMDIAVPVGFDIDTVAVQPTGSMQCVSEPQLVRCSTATLAPGSNVGINVVVTPRAVETPLLSTATITTTSPDLGREPNVATIGPIAVVPEVADLSVALFGSPFPSPDSAVPVTVFVSNRSPVAAESVEVVVNVPTGLSVRSYVWNAPTTCSLDGQTLRCSVSSIGAFSGLSLATVELVGGQGAAGDLVATVSSTTPDSDTTNNTASLRVVVQGATADLVVMPGVSTPTPVGTTTSFTFSTYNIGPQDATEASLSIEVPAPFTAVSAVSEGWDCTVADHLVTCAAQRIPSGAPGSVTITARADAQGSPTATATIGSAVTDPFPFNNAAAVALFATNPNADLRLDVFGPFGAVVGDPFGTTVAVSNFGPASARDVRLTVEVPEPLRVIGAVGTEWNCTITTVQTLTCAADVVPGGSRPVLDLTIVADAPGSFPISATVAASTPDPDPSNDSATTSVTVSPVTADVGVFLVQTDTLPAGEPASVQAVLQNGSFRAAEGVVATLRVSGGRIESAAIGDAACADDAAGVATCEVGRVGAFALTGITAVVTPNVTSTFLVVEASITTTTNDPNPFNDRATAVASVVAPGTGDLAARFVADDSAFAIGAATDVEIGLVNFGPTTVPRPVVTMQLPAAFEVVSVQPDPGVVCTTSAGAVRCETSPLAPFERAGAAVTLRGVELSEAAGDIVVSTGGATVDPQPFNDVYTWPVSVVPDEADLSASLSGPEYVEVGGQSAFLQLQVHNQGPAPARGVVVDVALPTGLEYASAAGFSCEPDASGGARCTHPNIPSGGTLFAIVEVRATSVVGRIEVGASVSGAQPDPVPGNETAIASLVAVPTGSVDLSVFVPAVRAVVGQPSSVAIFLAAQGPSAPATDVRVIATFPPELRPESAGNAFGPGDCTIDGQTVECAIPTVFGAQIVVDVTALAVVASASFTVSVSASSFDPDPSDNEVVAAVEVVPADSDMVLLGGSEPPPFNVGQVTDPVQVFVYNQGVAPALGATLTLEPAEGLLIESAIFSNGEACTPIPDGTSWICSLGDVRPGDIGTVTYFLRGTTPVIGATVRATTTATNDIDPSNDQSSFRVDVYPEGASDLFVQMLATRVDELGTTDVIVDVASIGPAMSVSNVELRIATPGLAPGSILLTDLFGNPADDGVCTVDGEAIVCRFAELGAFVYRTLRFTASPVRSVTAARIMASVAAPAYDPRPDGNTAFSDQYDIALQPGAPSRPVGSASDSAVPLAWSAPTPGGDSVTDYLVEYSSDGGASWTRFADGSSIATGTTVSRLANGASYVFRVAAVNRFGQGEWSEVSAPVTPSLPPRTPAKPEARAGNQQVILTWQAPSQRGRNPIIDYVIQYSSDRGRTWTTFDDGISAGTRTVVTGLTNGTRYTFRVAAASDAGQGRFSDESNAVTPRRR